MEKGKAIARNGGKKARGGGGGRGEEMHITPHI